MSLGYLDLLKALSFIVNGVFAFIWLRRRLNMHLFLQGHWHGSLSRADQPGLIYAVDLFMSDHKNQSDSGIMIYQVSELASQKVLFSGIDVLREYDGNLFFALNRKWKPEFVRRFHVTYPDNGGAAPPDFMPIRYRYECVARSLWVRPSLELAVMLGAHKVHGRLNKMASS
jgi:hypothetical protein